MAQKYTLSLHLRVLWQKQFEIYYPLWAKLYGVFGCHRDYLHFFSEHMHIKLQTQLFNLFIKLNILTFIKLKWYLLILTSFLPVGSHRHIGLWLFRIEWSTLLCSFKASVMDIPGEHWQNRLPRLYKSIKSFTATSLVFIAVIKGFGDINFCF